MQYAAEWIIYHTSRLKKSVDKEEQIKNTFTFFTAEDSVDTTNATINIAEYLCSSHLRINVTTASAAQTKNDFYRGCSFSSYNKVL